MLPTDLSVDRRIPKSLSTHFRRLLSSITHLMPSIAQFEHVTSPSAAIWYLCMTSHRTFRARQAAHALAALRLTGFGFPSLSSPALGFDRFLELESSVEAGDWESLEPIGFCDSSSVPIETTAGIFLRGVFEHVIRRRRRRRRRQPKTFVSCRRVSSRCV
jgi:hypothetical protein